MTDSINQAIASVPTHVICDFGIKSDDGVQKQVQLRLPVSLTWEELVAVIDGVNHLGQKVVQAAGQKTGLVLARGTLPRDGA